MIVCLVGSSKRQMVDRKFDTLVYIPLTLAEKLQLNMMDRINPCWRIHVPKAGARNA
jgi:hypothetical protein